MKRRGEELKKPPGAPDGFRRIHVGALGADLLSRRQAYTVRGRHQSEAGDVVKTAPGVRLGFPFPPVRSLAIYENRHYEKNHRSGR
jgi:hypothetical protein